MDDKITWLGQNGYLLEFGKTFLCIDPYLSNSVARYGKYERLKAIPIKPCELNASIIICTHDHKDHFDEQTLKFTEFEGTLYVGPDTCVKHFSDMGITNRQIIPLRADETFEFGLMNIHGIYANHGIDSIGLVIEYKEFSIYFVGDSRYDKRLLTASKYNPNVLVCCINGKLGNMSCDEAAKLAQELNVKTAIPCHYGMFAENTEDPQRFVDLLKNSNVQGLVLDYNKEYMLKTII